MRSAYGAMSLERKFYCDTTVYEQEQVAIFSKSWMMLGRSQDLFENDCAQTDSYRSFEVAGNPIVIVRSVEGEVRGFHNVCRHRGATIVDQPAGCLEKGVLVCPYHAWSYNCQGKLVGAPNMASVENFQRDDFGLQPIQVQSSHGFIFVNLDVGAPSLDKFLKPLEKYLDTWSVAELESAVSIDYTVRANWKSIFENFNECYHCPTIHPALNRLTPYRTAENEYVEGPILGGPMQFAEGIETMSHSGKRVAAILPKLSPSQRRTVCYFTVFPSYFISFHPDFVLVHRLQSLAVDCTKITCEFLFHRDSMHDANFDPSPATDFWDLTNRQDWEVSERVQLGARSTFFRPGPLSNLESIVAAFDCHYISVLGIA